jgi:hypothetical protein
MLDDLFLVHRQSGLMQVVVDLSYSVESFSGVARPSGASEATATSLDRFLRRRKERGPKRLTQIAKNAVAIARREVKRRPLSIWWRTLQAASRKCDPRGHRSGCSREAHQGPERTRFLASPSPQRHSSIARGVLRSEGSAINETTETRGDVGNVPHPTD